MEATLTSKGQLTIPKSVRQALQLNAGDRIELFVRDDGHVEMVPKKRSLHELKGMIPPPVTGVTLEDMEAAISEVERKAARNKAFSLFVAAN